MGSILQFRDVEKEFKHVSYFDNDRSIGLKLKNSALTIEPLNKNDVLLVIHGKSIVFQRKELAEFLWVSSVLLDSEERHRPNGKLVGRNY